MSQCQQQDLLLDLVYEELGAAEAAALTDHVQGCAHCQGELTGLRGVRGLMKAAPEPELSSAALARMTERLLAEADAQAGAKVLPLRRRGLARVLFHPAAGVMAAAALALVVIAANGWRRTLAPALLPPPAVLHEEEPVAATTPALLPAAPAAPPPVVPVTGAGPAPLALKKAKAPLGYRVAPPVPMESLKKGSPAMLSQAADKDALDSLERSRERPADLPAKVMVAAKPQAPRHVAQEAAGDAQDDLVVEGKEALRSNNEKQHREELAQAVSSMAPAAAQAQAPAAEPQYAPPPPPPAPGRSYGGLGHASNSSTLLVQLRAQLKLGQCREAQATAAQLEQLPSGVPDEERAALQKVCARPDSNNQYAAPAQESNSNSNSSIQRAKASKRAAQLKKADTAQ